MHKKFKIELGRWKLCSVYSNSDCLNIYVENWHIRESRRFYFIEDCEFLQNGSNGNDIDLNDWRFSRTYQIHDAKKCWDMQDRISEKFTIQALTPDGHDCIFYVNDTINGLETIENLINTIYMISLCSAIEEAYLMIEFIHDKGMLSKLSPDNSFANLYRVKNIIINIEKAQCQQEFIDWLKRIYKEKYQKIVDDLRYYKPSI